MEVHSGMLLGTAPVRECRKQVWAEGKLNCDADAAEASADPVGVLVLGGPVRVVLK